MLQQLMLLHLVTYMYKSHNYFHFIVHVTTRYEGQEAQGPRDPPHLLQGMHACVAT